MAIKLEEKKEKKIYYQYFYFNYGQLVCGVRLYETDEEWQSDHWGIKYVKRVPIEIDE